MKIAHKDFTLRWITPKPIAQDKVALLVPAYNELTESRFFNRLEYLKGLAEENLDRIDIILVDDGSSDDSLVELERFIAIHPCKFHVCAVWPNGNKVGAQQMVVNNISHKYIIMSDFDTDIGGLEHLEEVVKTMDSSPSLMGYYFKLLPYDGKGQIFSFQLLEYAVTRGLYKLYKEGSVPVMPGAGSIYRRSVLLEIFTSHSGFRSGEDRESTSIGLAMGYKTLYKQDILALTRTPPNFDILVKQRIRWYLGYLETFFKEKKYYTSFLGLSTIGIKAFLDLLIVLVCIFLPYILIAVGFVHLTAALSIASFLYLTCVFFVLGMYSLAKEEFKEIRNLGLAIALYPFIKWVLEYLSWTKAILRFFKGKRKGIYDYSKVKSGSFSDESAKRKANKAL